METRWKEFAEGEVRFRDDLQFELKSEFAPAHLPGQVSYTQEFYIFIPKALQVTKQTYNKDHFYEDQSNFIRYKTPEFTLAELLDEENRLSPLLRIRSLIDNPEEATITKEVQTEIKLYGNIVRSSLRRRTRLLISRLQEVPDTLSLEEFSRQAMLFFGEIQQLRSAFLILRGEVLAWNSSEGMVSTLKYVDEFISNATEYFLTAFLERLRQGNNTLFGEVDKKLSTLLASEMHYRGDRLNEEYRVHREEEADEFLLYRKGLLNKFVLDSLMLRIDRTEIESRYSHLVGMVAAGIAMFVYLLLFIWQGEHFVINSAPFVVVTSILYILKDRMKEGVKLLFKRFAFRIFPDFETTIWTPDGSLILGALREWFHFIPEKRVPKDIYDVRNRGFHQELKDFPRPESVLNYRKQVQLNGRIHVEGTRRCELNTIFRFNIHRFIRKASNSRHFYPHFDPDTHQIHYDWLPKVYHINVIMKNSYESESGEAVEELQKFRLIVNKQGIKRVEEVH